MTAMEEYINELVQQSSGTPQPLAAADVVYRSQLLADSQRDLEEGR